MPSRGSNYIDHNALRRAPAASLRMRALVVVSGGYGDEMGVSAVNVTVMFAVRYL